MVITIIFQNGAKSTQTNYIHPLILIVAISYTYIIRSKYSY